MGGLRSYFTSFDEFLSDDILHVGVGHDDGPPGRGSGRYGWGTGENPNQHQFTFLSEVKKMKKNGLRDAEIAKALLGPNATSTDLRAELSIQRASERKINRERAIKMLDECGGNKSEAARRLGLKNESSLRSLLDEVIADRTDRYQNTADVLKKVIDKKKYVDVSSGTELYLGVPDYTKKVAISILEKEGYVKTWIQVPQAGTDKKTTIMVMAPPGTPKSEIQQNKFNVKPIQDFTPDEGKTWWVPEFPESVDSKRVLIRYNEEGGKEKDGVIELRRGVEDISLGDSQYAQVRIAVNGTHYMKGMAIYADEIPKGYDIIYNTNKHVGTPMMTDSGPEVLKRMKIDPDTGEVDRDNPFGALIKSPKDRNGVISAGGQRHYIGTDGKQHLSPINKLQDEGDWDSWSRNLSSQFLSKQPLKLINQQIELSINSRKAELDKINQLTNPVIKKKLLEDYAKTCDANASDLSVKGFKNQAFQVILPIPELKDNEIYAPKFKDGDTVALVRYPHGGIFEIPVLKVNNKQPNAKKVMENASDAVGINSKVAEILSGADFDGDTALVIPLASNRINVSHKPPLEGLKDFDAKEIYKLPEGVPGIKPKTKQNEMGRVTNLITDMTVGGANEKEICKAVKHSMVVIDSEKHHLDYKQSAIDNDIQELKKKYQGINPTTGQTKGASTILSRASSKKQVPNFKEVTDTKKMTPEELNRWNEGKKVLRPTGELKKERIKDPNKMTPQELELHQAGKKVYRESAKLKTTEMTQMDMVDDARDLVRDKDNSKEMAYANYANELKSLANQARKTSRNIKPIPVSQSAKATYKDEVESLNTKLRVALMNSPRERQAQVLANAKSSAKFKSNPDMDFEHRQRQRAMDLASARAEVGAKKELIEITDKEWEAIQANAISTNKLSQILNNTDQEAFKKRATPRSSNVELTPNQIKLIKSMSKSGMYTQSDIADALGVSTSTVSNVIRNG